MKSLFFAIVMGFLALYGFAIRKQIVTAVNFMFAVLADNWHSFWNVFLWPGTACLGISDQVLSYDINENVGFYLGIIVAIFFYLVVPVFSVCMLFE